MLELVSLYGPKQWSVIASVSALLLSFLLSLFWWERRKKEGRRGASEGSPVPSIDQGGILRMTESSVRRCCQPFAKSWYSFQSTHALSIPSSDHLTEQFMNSEGRTGKSCRLR